MLDAVEAINQRQKHLLVDKLIARFGELHGKVVALWGLAFKPKTDDIREAPALTIIDALLSAGAHVRVTDPAALEHGRRLYAGKDVVFSEDPYAVLQGADAWLLVTEWQEFRRPDFQRIRGLMRGNLVLDGRNVYDPQSMRALGFDYQGIGRH
jgi:UDPglucose 6-dehydrogenase